MYQIIGDLPAVDIAANGQGFTGSGFQIIQLITVHDDILYRYWLLSVNSNAQSICIAVCRQIIRLNAVNNIVSDLNIFSGALSKNANGNEFRVGFIVADFKPFNAYIAGAVEADEAAHAIGLCDQPATVDNWLFTGISGECDKTTLRRT